MFIGSSPSLASDFSGVISKELYEVFFGDSFLNRVQSPLEVLIYVAAEFESIHMQIYYHAEHTCQDVALPGDERLFFHKAG